jgi:hypothetical protein
VRANCYRGGPLNGVIWGVSVISVTSVMSVAWKAGTKLSVGGFHGRYHASSHAPDLYLQDEMEENHG